MNEVFLCLGGNLGNREENLMKAIKLIRDKTGIILEQSKIYETASWGITEQPNFLNCVIKMSTKLSPKELLFELLTIEKLLGRERKIKWGSRIIDIDILSYKNEIINDEELKIPHPFLQDRNFVLVPFSEISPNWVHPILNKTILQLHLECNDKSKVEEFKFTL